MFSHDRFYLTKAMFVDDWNNNATGNFQKIFNRRAAALKDGQLLSLRISDTTVLKTILVGEHPSVICTLQLGFKGDRGDATMLTPLLIAKCPQLDALEVNLWRPNALDFVTSVLEHPDNNIRVLKLSEIPIEGDFGRFEAALRQSRVENLTIACGRQRPAARDAGVEDAYFRILVTFLEDGQVQRLHFQTTVGCFVVPHLLYVALSNNIRVQELVIDNCEFREHVAFASPYVRAMAIAGTRFLNEAGLDLPRLSVIKVDKTVSGAEELTPSTTAHRLKVKRQKMAA